MKNDIRKQLLVRFPLKSSSQLDEVIESGREMRPSVARANGEDLGINADEGYSLEIDGNVYEAYFLDGALVDFGKV